MTIQNASIWIGICFLIGFTLCYMTAVSWADYSFVMPAGAFGYAIQTMLAIVVLHEVRFAKAVDWCDADLRRCAAGRAD